MMTMIKTGMLVALIVGHVGSSHSVTSSSRMLQDDVADDTANEVPVNLARAANIVDHYIHSDLAPHPAADSIASRHSDVQLSITEEEPESHNLHSDSIEEVRTRERKREGTIKYNKKNKGGGTKGTKGVKKGNNGGGDDDYNGSNGGRNSTVAPSPSPKKKSVKGEKSKEPTGYDDGDDDDDEGNGGNEKYGPKDDKYGDEGDDDGDDDGHSPTFRAANETSTAPMISPTLSLAPKSAPPIQPPPPPTNVAEEQESETVPEVSRLIPAFRIGYTTDQADTPDSSDYSELGAITRNFLHDTLTSYFAGINDASVNDIMYMSTELEFYFIRGVYVMEYQFKTKWGGGGNQVPSIPELNVVVKSFFDKNVQTYISGLQSGLRPENAFSTTAGIALGSQGTITVPSDGAPPAADPLEQQDENDKLSSHVATKIIIPIAVIAGAVCVLGLFVFLRRRKVVPAVGSVASNESESLKADEDYTLDTAPMSSINASIVRNRDPRRPDPRRSSSGEVRQHSSIYMESGEELIDHKEDGFEDIPIDHLAEV